jgi:putative Holliday junction resolvase
MRILAVDPGEKRLGIALSDPTGTIANPMTVVHHISRIVDAAAIADLARSHQVDLILIGQALGADGEPTPQSRRAVRLAEMVRSQINLPVELWDESGSTAAARSARVTLGIKAGKNRMRRKYLAHLDDIAATVILQSYLDTISKNK